MKALPILKIRLSNGMVAIIDGDLAHLAEYKWSASVHRKNGKVRIYAVRQLDGKRFALHREVMGNPPGDVDHIDANNMLDCRRSNLRLASRSQNNANARKRPSCSSRFKGVSIHRETGKWTAQISKRHLGLFATEEDAARAYNAAALEEYGEYARTNQC